MTADQVRSLGPSVRLAVALAAAVWMLAAFGPLVPLAAIIAAALLVVIGALAAWHDFAMFICGAIILRPVLDLLAGPRSTGIGPTDLFGVSVLVACLAWLFVNRVDLYARLRSRFALSLLAFLVVLTLSAAGAPYLSSSFPVVLRIMAGVATYFVLDLMLARRQMAFWQLVGALGLAYVVPLIYPIVGLVGVPVTHRKDAITALKSVFYLSNNFGHFLVPVVVITAAWMIRVRGRPRVVAGLVLLVAGAELVATQTRGAWIAVVVGVFGVGLLLSRRFVVASVIVVVLISLFVPPVQSRIENLRPSTAPPRSESSFAWRLGHWSDLVPRTKEQPLLGLGPDEAVRLTGKEPHNDYVRALAETGVLGLAAYLWFLVELCVLAGRAVRRRGRPLTGFVRPRTDTDPGVGPLASATVIGLACYAVGIVIASSAENLIDNLTFLWVAMPCAALLQWAAQDRRLDPVGPGTEVDDGDGPPTGPRTSASPATPDRTDREPVP
ncbi:O-antigen ligase family protein [Nocardioides sp.]|uniref:O-antigen ligase family protein n=1 Tax=Nocardioides sp. TaxID=35761 RepID=UPI003566D63B